MSAYTYLQVYIHKEKRRRNREEDTYRNSETSSLAGTASVSLGAKSPFFIVVLLIRVSEWDFH